MEESDRRNSLSSGMPSFETEGDTVTFRAAFEPGVNAQVVLIDHASGTVTEHAPFHEMPYGGNMREACVRVEDRNAADYVFMADDRVVTDPKAVVIRGREHFGSFERRKKYQVRCSFPEEDFDWGEAEKAPMIPYDQVIAYGLHVRGFTRQSAAKDTSRGTFTGLTERTGYLRELGINQIVLMPCYEFEEIEEKRAFVPSHVQEEADAVSSGRKLNYWGFAKSWYFAPKAGYCATDRPDTEFKTMVRAMHRAGIEVVMEFAFPDTVAEDLALEALRFWVTQYHVDGFLLFCRPAIAYMAAHDAQLARTKLMTGYFDPQMAYPDGRGKNIRNLANCNNGYKTDMRKALKGDADMMSAFMERVRQDGQDTACVNYLTAHDGFTMMDLVSYDKKHNDENGEFGQDGAQSEYSWNCGVEGPTRKRQIRQLRLRQIKNAFAMLLLSRGTPMLLAGDETGNSQGGNSNPYCIDSPVTWVDWSSRRISQDIYAFVKEMIAFRKAHPLLSSPDSAKQTSCGYPLFSSHSERAWFAATDYQTRHVGLMYAGVENGEETYIYAAYNFHWDPQSFALPYLPEELAWHTVIDTGWESAHPAQDGKEEVLREFTLPGRTVRVLLSVRKQQEMKNDDDQKSTLCETGNS